MLSPSSNALLQSVTRATTHLHSNRHGWSCDGVNTQFAALCFWGGNCDISMFLDGRHQTGKSRVVYERRSRAADGPLVGHMRADCGGDNECVGVCDSALDSCCDVWWSRRT